GRREVVVPVGDHDALLPAQRLHLLFDTRMQIADDWSHAADDLALQVDDQSQHTMRARVLGAEVDREEIPLVPYAATRLALNPHDRAPIGRPSWPSWHSRLPHAQAPIRR